MKQETDDAAVGADAAVVADSAIQTDAYIDALLAGHSRVPAAVEPEPENREAIHLLENLPRFHPSFMFEEWLSSELQAAAQPHPPGEIVQIVIRPEDTGTRAVAGTGADRRLLVGGAIASGVSIAGAAVFAWRRTRHVPGSAD
jgi:hypothetical protein